MEIAEKTIEELKTQYHSDTRPWVVTYSGGKDSTTVLHLVITMLQDLHKEGKDTKHVYVVSSDTKVEMPVIDKYFFKKMNEIDSFVKKENLNVSVHVVSPDVKESFWTLLLGKGYPSPNQNFRWCTDRLKVNPATKFLAGIIEKESSILMLLGVRSDESQTRAQSIEKRDRNHRDLVKHDTVPNAFVLSPIRHWTNNQVWSFLKTTDAPWGQHTDMLELYTKGSGEADCNITFNPEAPSCGKTRFGCWVCTVVSKDKSMENMLHNDEDKWMKPLHDFRNKLEEYRYDHSRRQERRRNGQLGVGPFKMSIRKELLTRLLKIEEKLIDKLEGKRLISNEEIVQIQEEWLNDGDFFDSAINIAHNFNRDLQYDSKKTYTLEEKQYFKSLCEENNINIELLDKLLQTEHEYRHQLKRSGVLLDIENIAESFALGKINEI